MARIPEDELERIKSEVSVQRLVETSGIELKRVGRDLVALCPFHREDTPSFKVSPTKNVWHCLGCGASGGPIDWVMQTQGLSFRHAVELLQADPALAASAGAVVKRSTVRKLAAPVAADAEDGAVYGDTTGYYHEQMKKTAAGPAYLKARGLTHPLLIDTFRLGVADRTLGLRLPNRQRADGAAIRERLNRLGLYRDTGHEHFNGCLVIPVLDEHGRVQEIYGRKMREDKRDEERQARHLYLPQPEGSRRARGVFNIAGIIEAGKRPEGQREVIWCEALIDALTFWCHGFTNVSSSYGTNGFTSEMLAALKAHAIERVLIAYDRDPAGDAGAEELAALLIKEGFEVLRVLFPKGMDANEFACKMSPPEKALGLVVRQAQWIGTGRAAVPAAPQEQPAPAQETPNLPCLAADNNAARATPVIEAGADAELPAELPDELQMQPGVCAWRVRGWKKNTTPEHMRVNLQVKSADGAAVYMDTLDLYAARSRASFVKQASVELGQSDEQVKRELAAVFLKLQDLQDELLAQARRPATPAVPILSAEEQREALALLHTPNLLQRFVDDLQTLGVVGEDMNLMAAVLAVVSRKLDTPLAVLIQSTSAAGKSALMDAVLSLVPPEERIRYSAMTGQSLYYLGETNLQHKILAIAEEEGVRQAAYALKLLQSDGELTIASTAKDEATGNLQTRQYTVKGPVMLMLTTTAIDVDEELLNRCLVLSVNESPEQTAAIHARQREKRTLEGLLQRAGREQLTKLHHNAQRLLAGVHVVNPWAKRLTFLAHKTRTRRDHVKYLALIESIALLHQHQREVKTAERGGQVVRYIEATKQDIALANQVAHEVLGRTLDELPPQTRKLLRLIAQYVGERAAAKRIQPARVRFTRRDVREATGWSDSQLKVHCARLADMEYLLVHGGSRGHALSYELLWDAKSEPDARRLCGLIEPDALDGFNELDGEP
jgi:DNA primase